MGERIAKLKINEIFFSIQGESSWAGYPTVFVRTSGCHLRCTYCDTTYAYHEGDFQTVDEVLAKIEAYGAKFVCVTGGEPLLQPAIYGFMDQLIERGYHVSLETSGDVDCVKVNPKVKKIIDVKTPDSGEPDAFCQANLHYADKNSEFKFVICSPADFDWAERFAGDNQLFARSNVLYSPSYAQTEEKWLAEKILFQKSPARLQLQLHKYIWSAQKRGV